MNKEQIINRYKLPKNAKITLYRNPREFKYYELEPINPTHKIILWGILKKKYQKTKFNTRVYAGRINIPFIAFVFSTLFIDVNLTVLILNVVTSIILSYCIYAIPILGLKKSMELIKNAYWYSRWFGFRQNYIIDSLPSI